MNESSPNGRDEGELRHECCPVCMVVKGAARMRSRYSGFFTHMANAQIEFLQAFRSLIDQHIAHLEERRNCMQKSSKATKIKVE